MSAKNLLIVSDIHRLYHGPILWPGQQEAFLSVFSMDTNANPKGRPARGNQLQAWERGPADALQ